MCVFVLVLVVYTCVCSCLLKSPEHQPEARQRKPVFVIFTVCAFSLTLCVVLFLVRKNAIQSEMFISIIILFL